MVHPECWVYIAIRDLVNDVDLALVYKDETEDSPFWRVTFSNLSAPDRLTTRELGIQVPSLVAPKPGNYSLELYADDELMGVAKIAACLIEQENTQ